METKKVHLLLTSVYRVWRPYFWTENVCFFSHSHNLDKCIVFTSGIYSGVYCLLSAFYSIPKYFQSNLIKRTEPNHFRSDCIDSMNKSIYKSEPTLTSFFLHSLLHIDWTDMDDWYLLIPNGDKIEMATNFSQSQWINSSAFIEQASIRLLT